MPALITSPGFSAETPWGVPVMIRSPGRSGTELLPVSASSGRAADEYSRLAPTAKIRAGQVVECDGVRIAVR